MKSFHLVIASPNGTVYEGDTVMLSLRGQNGDLAILAGHAPFVTPVVACDVKIEREEDELYGHTDGGLLSVGAETVTLLSGSFRLKQE